MSTLPSRQTHSRESVWRANCARLARKGGTASTAGTAQFAGDMLNIKTSRNAMGRKKMYTDEELREYNRERARRYYALHRDEMIRRNLEWRRANPDRIREYGKRQRKRRNVSQYNSEYYRKNRQRLIELASDWRKANPEKVKGYNDKQKELRKIEAERKKLDRVSLEAQASIFRDPQAAEHFKWLAERVRRKKEQSLLQAAR